MKKVLLFLAVTMIAFTAMAQEKVAILEVVDKTGEVNYGVKLLLRSSLTTAISNTPGYEGYDRVDVASILGEHEFQRTGVVNDNQIKKLGKAAGARYVMVAEAAKYDEERIIITAKLLDVETFGVKSNAVQISGTSADDMKKSSELLAKNLIKPTKELNKQMRIDLYDESEYTRSMWYGISIEGGGAHHINDYYLGISLDLSFLSITNWITLGPYASYGICICRHNKHTTYENAFKFGGIVRACFKNDIDVLLGGGIGADADDLCGEIRAGIKFKQSYYLTASIEPSDFYAFAIGFGYSFGGKLQKRQ